MLSTLPYRTVAAVALAAAFALPALASSQTQQSPPAASQLSPAQQTADRDFGKVSADGYKAFGDIRMARLAIFDGKPNDALKNIKAASASLQKASTDESVFIKAEADLKPPKGVTQPTDATGQPAAGAVQWLPIDGTMAIAEDYTQAPAKAASVAKANTQLKSGDHAHALETLKLAGVDVIFDEAVAPLHQSVDGVNQAEQLAQAGKYYEANQALKGVQDGIRFDEQDLATSPSATHVAAK
jgi:hypothetical protein